MGTLVLIFTFVAIDVPREAVVLNDRDVACCTWDCLQTLGIIHDIRCLKDIVNERIKLKTVYSGGIPWTATSGHRWMVTSFLRKHDVDFDWQPAGNYTKGILRRYANKYGAIISIDTDIGTSHSLIMVEFNEAEGRVAVYDPNNGLVRLESLDWLDRVWNGRVIVVLPDGPDLVGKPHTPQP